MPPGQEATMTTFAGDGGLFVSDLLVIGLLVLLAVVLGFGLTVTFIVWRLVRGVRRWVARRRGVAAAQPRMVRKPGPARDVAKLRRELSDEVSAAELMLSRAKNGRVFVADAQTLLDDLKVGAASLDANMASVQNYSDAAQQRAALEALRPQVAKLIETSYLARQTVLQTEIADRERHLTDLTPGPTQDVRPVRRALISVFDKTGLDDLVRGLHEAGVELVSTGGSAALIESLGLPVTKVEELTGFPECLEGRVKTLHPRVHAGILADTRKPDHVAQLAELGVEAFELVVVNLYPFAATVASGAAADECVEQIDIGGPSMVRAAAKNHPSVAVVTDPSTYGDVLDAVRGGGFTFAQRKRLAAEAFVHTATYDVAVASWMGNAYTDTSEGTGLPGLGRRDVGQGAVLRYGENPHQRAALYTNGFQPQPGLAQATQLHGKEMSYNNYIDADAAVGPPTTMATSRRCAVIKHANPCGIAVGTDIAEAHRKAHECDPVSAFGGIIATNRPVTVEMARTVADIFTEVVVAPGSTTTP
jgi:hypothetical protein